jgi:two-component system chemotaxis response regulator CheY
MGTEQITKGGILIADGMPHMADLVAQMLRSLGRKDIRQAFDGERAVAELRRRPFQVLIVDADLAGLDGVALTRKLRSMTECENRNIPVIMMSSAPDAKRIMDARDAGVNEFLRKPFAVNHLNTRLISIEENPRGFIEAGTYVGPDRRRRTVDVDGPDRRTGSDN